MITIKDINNFSDNFNKNINKELCEEIRNNGITNTLLENKILEDNPFEFNIELPSNCEYDQLNSGRCWCISSIKMKLLLT